MNGIFVKSNLLVQTVRTSLLEQILLRRRFYYSDLLNTLDKNESSISLEVSEGLDSIELQFGSSNYGNVK